MRIVFLLLTWAGMSSLLHAQAPSEAAATQKFVFYVEPGGLFLTEPVEPGMTLYRLSKKYNVRIDSMLAANPDLNPASIPLGYPVNIPICTKAISFILPPAQVESIPLFYRVQPKETLFRISRVYLEAPQEMILVLNPRVDQGLAIGQVLHLGWYIPENNIQSPTAGELMASPDSTLYAVKDYAGHYKMEGKVIREQKGLAVWKPGTMQSHYYVLHPTAKVGSYMEVTNPMLHRTLTAKVAGNIPPGLYQSHVGLVVSPSLARALGILDQQFFARWRFVE